MCTWRSTLWSKCSCWMWWTDALNSAASVHLSEAEQSTRPKPSVRIFFYVCVKNACVSVDVPGCAAPCSSAAPGTLWPRWLGLTGRWEPETADPAHRTQTGHQRYSNRKNIAAGFLIHVRGAVLQGSVDNTQISTNQNGKEWIKTVFFWKQSHFSSYVFPKSHASERDCQYFQCAKCFHARKYAKICAERQRLHTLNSTGNVVQPSPIIITS